MRKQPIHRGFGEKTSETSSMLHALKRKRYGRDLRSVHELIRLNAKQLATGSLLFRLLLTVLIISFSLCKLCSFGHINAVGVFFMYFVVNQIFQSFDCISVLFYTIMNK